MEEAVQFVDYVDKRKQLDMGEITLRDYYAALTTQGKIKLDGMLSTMAMDFVDELCKVVPFLEYTARGYGYSGYTTSIALHRDGQACGLVAWGGANAGVYVSLTGKGMFNVNYLSLYQLLDTVTYPRITRVDLAFDSHDGEYNFEWCKHQYLDDGFNAGGRNPSCAVYMSGGSIVDDQIEFDGGRTFVVGKRQNGKMFRGYEKGKQLIGQGGAYTEAIEDWFRLEVEVHNTKRKIPLEVLLKPAEYMAGLFPCLSFVSQEFIKIPIKKKLAKVTLESLISHGRASYGAVIRFMSNELDLSDSEIVNRLKSKINRPPRRLVSVLNQNTG